jgi:membrane-associated protein
MNDIFQFLHYLFTLDWISDHPLGLIFVILIVFAETGLFVGFFLPGDSLMFVTGMAFAGKHEPLIDFFPMLLLVIAAGVLGNMVGYWFGKKSGALLFERADSLFFKKSHLLAAKAFYDKRGAATIFIARFLPIIRTFAPIVAGIVNMNYGMFMLYNVIGCAAWVVSLMSVGYFLGDIYPNLRESIEYILLALIAITTIPVIYKLITRKKAVQ